MTQNVCMMFCACATHDLNCRAATSPPSKAPATGSGCPTNARGVRSLSFMKVEVEKQPDSVSTLQIELPPEQVAKEWNAIAESFARNAKIPGSRPGKAPRRVIEAKFK